MPELCNSQLNRNGQREVLEAWLDNELFAHPVARDRLLDGTVWHPAARGTLQGAAREEGHAAELGVAAKQHRFPARQGKVEPCAAETWGFTDQGFEGILEELASLASARQRTWGVRPT